MDKTVEITARTTETMYADPIYKQGKIDPTVACTIGKDVFLSWQNLANFGSTHSWCKDCKAPPIPASLTPAWFGELHPNEGYDRGGWAAVKVYDGTKSGTTNQYEKLMAEMHEIDGLIPTGEPDSCGVMGNRDPRYCMDTLLVSVDAAGNDHSSGLMEELCQVDLDTGKCAECKAAITAWEEGHPGKSACSTTQFAWPCRATCSTCVDPLNDNTEDPARFKGAFGGHGFESVPNGKPRAGNQDSSYERNANSNCFCSKAYEIEPRKNTVSCRNRFKLPFSLSGEPLYNQLLPCVTLRNSANEPSRSLLPGVISNPLNSANGHGNGCYCSYEQCNPNTNTRCSAGPSATGFRGFQFIDEGTDIKYDAIALVGGSVCVPDPPPKQPKWVKKDVGPCMDFDSQEGRAGPDGKDIPNACCPHGIETCKRECGKLGFKAFFITSYKYCSCYPKLCSASGHSGSAPTQDDAGYFEMVVEEVEKKDCTQTIKAKTGVGTFNVEFLMTQGAQYEWLSGTEVERKFNIVVNGGGADSQVQYKEYKMQTVGPNEKLWYSGTFSRDELYATYTPDTKSKIYFELVRINGIKVTDPGMLEVKLEPTKIPCDPSCTEGMDCLGLEWENPPPNWPTALSGEQGMSYYKVPPGKDGGGGYSCTCHSCEHPPMYLAPGWSKLRIWKPGEVVAAAKHVCSTHCARCRTDLPSGGPTIPQGQLQCTACPSSLDSSDPKNPIGPRLPWPVENENDPHGKCMLYQDGTCTPECYPASRKDGLEPFSCGKACLQQAPIVSQREKDNAKSCSETANSANANDYQKQMLLSESACNKEHQSECASAAGCHWHSGPGGTGQCRSKCGRYFKTMPRRWWGWLDKSLGSSNKEAYHEVGTPRPDFVAICGMSKRVYCKPSGTRKGAVGEGAMANSQMDTSGVRDQCSSLKDVQCIRVCRLGSFGAGTGYEYGTAGTTDLTFLIAVHTHMQHVCK